jgi:hypothetical protein
MYLRAWTSTSCSGTESSVFTLDNGADVTPATQAAANPELVPECGLKVLLVLDESTSILNEGAVDAVRNGADAFVTALKDTGSKVAITAFGNTARDGVVPYQEVTSSTLSGFTNWIHDRVPGGYDVTTNTGTNWEDAFRHVPQVSGGPLTSSCSSLTATRLFTTPASAPAQPASAARWI